MHVSARSEVVGSEVVGSEVVGSEVVGSEVVGSGRRLLGRVVDVPVDPGALGILVWIRLDDQ